MPPPTMGCWAALYLFQVCVYNAVFMGDKLSTFIFKVFIYKACTLISFQPLTLNSVFGNVVTPRLGSSLLIVSALM